ncbi:hypothetical protein M9Y10_037414 [Tritrichomonas musculus]|uniref:PRA1 family protein n=1 Tax=Tritrichomonas musculus TaxID=1915356 RepID=A0ABR2GSH9_9EUKA
MSDQACQCPCKKCLTDPKELENKLKPYENYVEQIQAMLYFRNIIPMAILLVLVNLVFVFILIFHLSFVPTLFLLLTLRVLIKVVIKIAGEKIVSMFFKPIENKEEGTYPIYPLSTVCETVTSITSKVYCVASSTTPKGPITVTNAVIPLGVLAALFFLFLITGTLCLNWVLVDLILLLPAVLLHPAVKIHVQQLLSKLEKQKTD